MNEKGLKRCSKFLSLVLRHDPPAAELSLDPNGWANVQELLAAMNRTGMQMDEAGLQFIVENNDKKRFVLSEDRTRIRAAQGHSIQIDHQFEAKLPPAKLYHGTAKKNFEAIMREGLAIKKRHHVHLSADLETATKVGRRWSHEIVIFVVDCERMVGDGVKFYISENGVWLTDFVDPKYLSVQET